MPPQSAAQTSSGPLTQISEVWQQPISELGSGVPGVQAAPSQRRVVPQSPIAHASEGPLPPTSPSQPSPGLATLDHSTPSQWRMTPCSTPPTAQRSSGAEPQIP